MHLMKNLWIILLFLYVSGFSQSDIAPLRFQEISIDHGLPHNYIHSISQDKKGFIWIGTNYGLTRYDGYNFKIFQPDPQKPFSITHKAIGMVVPDSRENLWLSINSGGVNKMDLQTERFTGYFFDSINNISIGTEIKLIHEDSDSNIWISSNTGIFFYNRIADKFEYALSKKNINALRTYISTFVDDNIGNIWYLMQNKIYVLNKKTLEISTFGQIASNNKLDSIDYTSLSSKFKGELWFTTTRNGLLYYNMSTHTINSFLKDVVNVNRVFVDRIGNVYALAYNSTDKLYACTKNDIKEGKFESHTFFNTRKIPEWTKIIDDNYGNIWISSLEGFGKFNFNTGVTIYKSNTLIPNSISDNSVENMFIDRTDNLWICPLRKGINKADLRQKPFKLFTTQALKSNGQLVDKNVTSVFEDSKGNIWIGLNSCVSVYNKNTKKYSNFYINPSETIISIFEDIDGSIWLGTFGDFLLRATPQALKSLSENNILPLSSFELHDVRSVRKIVMDRSKNLWLASNSGLVEWDSTRKKLINHSALYDSTNLLNTFYRTVFIDRNQIIWTGSNSGGLCKYEKNKKKFTHYLHNPNNKQSISNNTVYAIHEDADGSLWVGTGQGLDKFNPLTETFEHAGIENELYKRSIFSVLPDKKECLWISCDIGIVKYNIKTKHSDFYGKADGLQNNELNTTASCLSKSGEIFFGGSGGLISFYPTEIKPNPIHAKPVITNILVRNRVISPGDSLNGRVLLQKQVWETNEITLNYDETDFTIEFSALHYSAPEKAIYQYKLEGFNSEWIYTNAKKRYATYTGLPPGEYTFVLKATNNDGLMCEPQDQVRLLITIIPPFWLTIWFKILIAVGLILLAILIISLRVRSLRKKNKLLDLKVKERTQELGKVNEFLEERTQDLEEANSILEERQEEINLQKEEILAQYETLENTNLLLQQNQKQILEQNIELDNHRNKLESLVEERTQELEKALIKAEQSDKLKTSFLTNMSHEIRTPMNAIIGFSSLLKDDSLKDRRDEFISIIQSNGRTLLTLINDILELSSIQSQQVSLKPLNNNLNTVLSRIYESFVLDTNQKKLILNFNIDKLKENFNTVFDEIRLKQVVSNLLSNAIKFTDTGSIEFGVYDISDVLTFYVKDTGIGISEDTGNAIFERFYKIESNKANLLYRGTGLGLAICKSLVELWQGDIWYKSEIGKGTTFFFTLPVSHKAIPDYVNEVDAEIAACNFIDKCILIADDEESNYLLLNNYLKKTSAKILWAKNGIEAISICKEQSIDLVLMDIKMPLMNGYEASRKIKELYPNLNIIAQTAFAYKNEIDEILSCGVNAYITKPINRKELLELISKFL
jgi:signal transduction histidine kinase/ligand-binding sensor domain-containing protein/CheY-like chemotaxis protein